MQASFWVTMVTMGSLCPLRDSTGEKLQGRAMSRKRVWNSLLWPPCRRFGLGREGERLWIKDVSWCFCPCSFLYWCPVGGPGKWRQLLIHSHCPLWPAVGEEIPALGLSWTPSSNTGNSESWLEPLVLVAACSLWPLVAQRTWSPLPGGEARQAGRL